MASEVGPVTRAEVAEAKATNLAEGVVIMQEVLTSTEAEVERLRAERDEARALLREALPYIDGQWDRASYRSFADRIRALLDGEA